MFGLGTPEIVMLIIVGAIFLFGAPKAKEWWNTFKNVKNEAKEITKA